MPSVSQVVNIEKPIDVFADQPENELDVVSTRLGEQPSPDVLGVRDVRSNLEPREKVDVPETNPVASSVNELTGEVKKSRINSQYLNLARSGINILNANFKFSQISAKAKLNIMLAAHQQREIISAGREAALREESKGFAQGEQALLNAAAQGIDVQSGVARSNQRAEETYGIFNAMAVEANAIRKAYGLEAQKVLEEYEVNVAEINRDAAIATSVLEGVGGSPGVLSELSQGRLL